MEETGQEKYEMGILCDDDDHMILFSDINYIIIGLYIYMYMRMTYNDNNCK